MKSRKTPGTVFYCCAIVFYVCAIFNIFNSGTRSMGVFWLCLGSAFLCLGTSRSRRDKNDHDDKDDKDEK